MDQGSVDDLPRWSLALDNENVRRMRALYMDLPESQREGYLALTAAVPPPILASSLPNKMAFMRFEDLFKQRGKVAVSELARAAERANALDGGPGSGAAGQRGRGAVERPGPEGAAREAAGPAAVGTPADCPLTARLGRSWSDDELKAWCDRFEAGCRALGVEPRLKLYA
jgi:pyruvate/2-oxoglutarate dehydrogenase complex dihydrolipoamide acyltransferase (E2) component